MGAELQIAEKPAVKRGRPRKSDIEAAKKPKKGQVGRPIGDNGRIAELKARLMATSGDKVINKIVQIALEDGNPGQVACLKMCIDRVLPLSLFEKDAKRGSNAVTINIVGVGETKIEAVEMEEAVDIDFTEVSNG